MLRVSKAMQYHRDRATKVCFLQFWQQEMIEKKMIKDMVYQRKVKLATLAIESLRRNARTQRQCRYLIDQG